MTAPTEPELVPATRAVIITGMPVLYTLTSDDVRRINATLARRGPSGELVARGRCYAVGEEFPATVLRHIDGQLVLVVHLSPYVGVDGCGMVGHSYTRPYPGENLGQLMLMPRLMVNRHVTG